MKNFSLVFLLAIGLLFSGQSFALSVIGWQAEASGADALQVGEIGLLEGDSTFGHLAIGDTAQGIKFNLGAGLSVSYYFDTLQALSVNLATVASGSNPTDWSGLLYNLDAPTSHIAGVMHTSNTSNDFDLFLPTVGSFVYTITNHSSDTIDFNVNALSAAVVPIPAALLLFGTAFAGLFGVKSYNSKKMAA